MDWASRVIFVDHYRGSSSDGDDAGPSTPGTICPTLEAVLDPVPAAPARRCYTRDFLVQCAASPLSRLTPDNWSQVVRQSPVVLKKVQCC